MRFLNTLLLIGVLFVFSIPSSTKCYADLGVSNQSSVDVEVDFDGYIYVFDDGQWIPIGYLVFIEGNLGYGQLLPRFGSGGVVLHFGSSRPNSSLSASLTSSSNVSI